MKKPITKADVLKNLPNGFKCSISRNGLIVQIWKKLKNLDEDFDASNKAVRALAKKFNLDEVGAGTLIQDLQRDWEFISLDAEAKMLKEANDVLKTMKAFFNKYGNSYCSSNEVYKVIDKMRVLVATDEN